jgi:hypothetical protein
MFEQHPLLEQQQQQQPPKESDVHFHSFWNHQTQKKKKQQEEEEKEEEKEETFEIVAAPLKLEPQSKLKPRKESEIYNSALFVFVSRKSQ